jgi:hypothetical protein
MFKKHQIIIVGREEPLTVDGFSSDKDFVIHNCAYIRDDSWPESKPIHAFAVSHVSGLCLGYTDTLSRAVTASRFFKGCLMGLHNVPHTHPYLHNGSYFTGRLAEAYTKHLLEFGPLFIIDGAVINMENKPGSQKMAGRGIRSYIVPGMDGPICRS